MEPTVVVEIKIRLTNTGQVLVEGPMENKVVFYGLLEVAKETAVEFNKQAERLVQPVGLFPAGVPRS